MEKKWISCRQAREYDMVNYLSRMGFEPTRIRENDYWYCSPFRTEKTASFKVNRRINRWYDFGEGIGGDIIDFAVKFGNCTIGEFLKSLEKGDILSSGSQPAEINSELPIDNSVKILSEKILSSTSLLEYLNERRIPIRIAEQYCREVRYSIKEKIFYAIGFCNDMGGWELRNKYFKGSSSPKACTSITTGSGIVCVFEGFFDFLSFLTIVEASTLARDYDYVILNSLSLFEKSHGLCKNYKQIHLYLDNDESGKKLSLYASSLDRRYRNYSGLYSNYKDLNEFLCYPGNANVKR